MNSPQWSEAIRTSAPRNLGPDFLTIPVHNTACNRPCMKARGGCPIHISVIPVTREKKGEDKLGKRGKGEGDAKHGNESREVGEESEGKKRIM